MRGISFGDDMLKANLLTLVRLHKSEPTYEIDNIIRREGHKSLRLPPYHPDFNPTALIWNQLKCIVRQKNFTFKFVDIYYH